MTVFLSLYSELSRFSDTSSPPHSLNRNQRGQARKYLVTTFTVFSRPTRNVNSNVRFPATKRAEVNIFIQRKAEAAGTGSELEDLEEGGVMRERGVSC